MKDETVTTFSYHSSKKKLFTASQNLQYRVWNEDDDEVSLTWKASAHRTPATSSAFDTSGTLIATGGSDRNVFVWDARKGHCTHSFKGHTGVVNYLQFHPDARRLLLFTCSDDTTIRVWDLVSHKCVAVLSSHMSVVTSLSFSKDGYTMLSAGRDKIVNVFELRNYGLEKTIPMFESVEAIEILSEKRNVTIFATAGEKGLVRTWNLQKDGKKYSCKQDHSETSTKPRPYIALLKRTDDLVGITNDHIFKFFNIGENDTNTLLQRERQFVGYNEEIFDLKYMDQDRVVMATNSESFQIVNTQDYNTSIFTGHEGLVLAVSVSPCGRFVSSVSKDNTCRVWDVSTGMCRGICVGHTDAVGAVAMSQRNFSEAEAWAVTASKDKTIKIWDLRSILKKSNDENNNNNNKIKRLSTLANQMAHAKDINDVAISPNDRVVATASQDKTIKLWSVNPANKGNFLSNLKTLKGHKRGVWSVSFSNVDKCIVSGSADRTVRLWSLEEGTCVGVFEGHTASVLRVRFVNLGMQLLSAGADGLLKLWTIRSSECVNTFEAHEEKIWAMDTSPNGKAMVTGSADSSLKVWEDCTAELDMKDAEERENKILQAQELSNMVRNGKQKEAALLALRLERPHQLRKICTHVLENSSMNDSNMLESFVKSLRDEEMISRLVEYVSQWNTSSKNSRVAQLVLENLLKFISLERLKFLAKKQNDSTLADAIISYSERHFRRLDRLLESSYVIDYTLHAMGTVMDEEEEEEEAGIEEPPTKRVKLNA